MEVRIKRSNRENPAFDELYHWKCIKKERVNGKWRYYYENDEKNSNPVTIKESLDARQRLKSAERQLNELKNRNSRLNGRLEDWYWNYASDKTKSVMANNRQSKWSTNTSSTIEG